jgi:hypothetical protein
MVDQNLSICRGDAVHEETAFVIARAIHIVKREVGA